MTQLNQKNLQLSDFDYHLPEELIAQTPAEPRDSSRLLVVNRSNGEISHHHFYDLPNLLPSNALLVKNTSKVLPARLHGKRETGGAIEVFLLHQESDLQWKAMLRGKKMEVGTKLYFSNNFIVTLLERINEREWLVETNKPDITSIGEVPLPPYIHTEHPNEYAERYQTVYANTSGSVAAPTAGLHFTPSVLSALESNGVDTTDVLLHVGLGTFLPVEVEDISQHVMHEEYGSITEASAAKIAAAKQAGKTVVSVGTTSVRTLEAFSESILKGEAHDGWIDIFITPGFNFSVTDALITNFHLPKSTLLMLVAAFAGKELMDEAYAIAVQEKYRFYSFGDAMLII